MNMSMICNSNTNSTIRNTSYSNTNLMLFREAAVSPTILAHMLDARPDLVNSPKNLLLNESNCNEVSAFEHAPEPSCAKHRLKSQYTIISRKVLFQAAGFVAHASVVNDSTLSRLIDPRSVIPKAICAASARLYTDCAN